jgi:UDPglucose--hexose-1-phosphate uridylyltransferase
VRPATVSEFRQDPLTGRWVIIAESRSARPTDYTPRPAPAPADGCPFCEGHEASTPPEVAADRPAGSPANGPGWAVRAFPNKFPSLGPEARIGPDRSSAPDGARRPGWGIHEVVVASPRHDEPLARLPIDATSRALRVVRDRMRALERTEGVAACVAFENSGPDSGGTLVHPHFQVVALGQVPPLLQEESDGLAHRQRGECGLERMVGSEHAAQLRLVVDDVELTAFAPFASEQPYELCVVPRRHAPSFGAATDAEVAAVARLLPTLLGALDAIAPGASYNLITRSYAPSRPEAVRYHWHLDLRPRLVRPDGFELGGGIPVNPVPPEAAAEAYRREVGPVRSKRAGDP